MLSGSPVEVSYALAFLAMKYWLSEPTTTRSLSSIYPRSFLVFRRPDMTFAVDWALSNNYISFLSSPDIAFQAVQLVSVCTPVTVGVVVCADGAGWSQGGDAGDLHVEC